MIGIILYFHNFQFLNNLYAKNFSVALLIYNYLIMKKKKFNITIIYRLLINLYKFSKFILVYVKL